MRVSPAFAGSKVMVRPAEKRGIQSWMAVQELMERVMLEYYRFKVINDLFSKGLIEEAGFQLVELQRRYVALCDENTTLKSQMQEYEDIIYLKDNLHLRDQFYWLVTGSIRQGPFCPKCYDRHGLLTRLSGEPSDRRCAYCGAHYRGKPELAPASIPGEEYAAQGLGCDYSKPMRKAKVIPFG